MVSQDRFCITAPIERAGSARSRLAWATSAKLPMWLNAVQQGGLSDSAGIGPFLPVGDRQLSKVQRPVPRFAPELAASECRVVVISAGCPAGDDPPRNRTLSDHPHRGLFRFG
jgi:hypothetical protein